MTIGELAGTVPPSGHSRSVDQARQEIARMPVTEACLSGICDNCLDSQTCLCDTGGRPGEGWHFSKGHFGK